MSLNLDRSTWKYVKLGDVVLRSRVQVDPVDGGVDRYVAGGHVDTESVIIGRSGNVADGQMGSTFRYFFKPGQVLFVSARPYLRKVGVPDFAGVVADKTYVLDAVPGNGLLHDMLPFLLTSDRFIEYATQEATGSMNPRLLWGAMQRYEFHLPPLDEQKHIADLLWAVERERQGSDQLLRSAIATRDAVIELRFVVDANETLQELCASDGIRIGPFGAQLHAYDYVEDGACPVVMPQDMIDGRVSTANIQRITDERAQDLAVHRLQSGDVVLPRRGELDRRALITETEDGWLCGTGSVRVRLREGVSNQAVFLALSSATTVDWLKVNATGTTMPNLNAGIVAHIPISLPTGEALEAALKEVDLLDRSARAIRSRIAATAALRSSLLSDIFGDN